MTAEALICAGEVVHVRLRARHHRLRYHVFALMVDVDALDHVARGSRLFSYNRAGVVSLHDRDYGAGDGTPIAVQARRVLADHGLPHATARVRLLTYPRVFGYTFNPLSVYFGYDAAGELAGVIYEVSNTVGERTSYVMPAGAACDGVYAQACRKHMYVSPFTPAAVDYGFRLRPPGDDVLVGVLLTDTAGPILRAHFRAEARPFGDLGLIRVLLGHPLLTLKVIGAIHWEALRLWFKGVPVVQRHRSPRYSVLSNGVDRRG
ncbi:MAG: DUF1365 domain-containing protein [Hyphomicrobiaceae bacterium]